MKVELITHTNDPETLIATTASICYGNKVAKNPDGLVRFLKEHGHLSPFEHVSFTFLISGISRNCSHQIVRHRIASYTQRSQRYCLEGESFVIPDKMKGEAEQYYLQSLEAYNNLLKKGIPKEDARYILPGGMETELYMTINARSLFNFFDLRLAPQAQWEIREVAEEMLKLVKKVSPVIFENYP